MKNLLTLTIVIAALVCVTGSSMPPFGSSEMSLPAFCISCSR